MTHASFPPDRRAYLQTHVLLALLAMPLAMLVLWLTGTPHIWTGAVGGLAAVVFRGWFLYSEEMGHLWQMTDTALDGPQMRHVPLADLARVRKIGSAVQLVTHKGDKHLIRFQRDPDATVARIKAACPDHGGAPE